MVRPTLGYSHLNLMTQRGGLSGSPRYDIWSLFTENRTLLFYFLVINLVSFVMFGLDKLKAKTNSYRIPEKTLFSFALMGGTPGVILAMLLFRHKTRKASFIVGLPLILILQLVLVFYTLNVTHL